jgi:hypothetical protein
VTNLPPLKGISSSRFGRIKNDFENDYGRTDVRTMLIENIPNIVVAFMWFNLPQAELCCPLELCGVWFPFLIC